MKPLALKASSEDSVVAKPRNGAKQGSEVGENNSCGGCSPRAGLGCLPDGVLESIDRSLPVRGPNDICLTASPPAGIDRGRDRRRKLLAPNTAELSRLVTFMLTSFAEVGAYPYLASSLVGGVLPYGRRRE